MEPIEIFPQSGFPGAVQHQYSRYEDNGGSIVAIGGPHYAVIGADTRLSQGMNILSRDHSKLRILTPKVVLGSSGNWADCDTLATIVELQVKKYALDHNEREISLNAAAYFMSSEMYKRRFSPFFVGNVMAGISEGRGYVYSYDPIGHIERQDYIAAGSAEKLLQPILDNQVGMKNLEGQPRQSQTQLSATKAVNLVRDAFVSAAERDIYTGDNLEILIITQCGIKKMSIALRKD